MAIRAVLAVVFVLAGCVSPGPVGERKPAAEGQILPAESIRLIGMVPNRYLNKTYLRARPDSDPGMSLSLVEISSGVITKVEKISAEKARELAAQPGTLELKRPDAPNYDVIYPGMINLHNHTEQNMLPVWWEAQGMFNNRYEWRVMDKYKMAMKFNMDPWSNYAGTPAVEKVAGISAAAYRWSELSAMVGGTLYLQGPSRHVENFAIQRAEDKAKMRAPMELFAPRFSVLITKYAYPLMVEQSGAAATDIEAVVEKLPFEKALALLLQKWCPAFRAETPDLLAPEAKSKYGDIGDSCVDAPKDAGLAKFMSEVFFDQIYPALSSLKGRSPGPSVFIYHLAEGRRDDKFTQMEFHILRMLGLARPNVHLVHATGVSRAGYKMMAQNKMGIVWSPLSNYLLYGQTTDVATAAAEGIPVAIGSDWTPTGSRTVLDELRFVRQLMQTLPEFGHHETIVSDEFLYKAVTETPAALINELENKAGDDRHGVGAVVPDAEGSIIVVSFNHSNPYKNLVDSQSKDIRLALIGGRPVYGDRSYVQSALKIQNEEAVLEDTTGHLRRLSGLKEVKFPVISERDLNSKTSEEVMAHVKTIVGLANRERSFTSQEVAGLCGFKDKVFVSRPSGNAAVLKFQEATGLNLDRMRDIERTLGLMLFTQSDNAVNPDAARRAYLPAHVGPLYSCDDRAFTEKFRNFVSGRGDILNATEPAKRAAARAQYPKLEQETRTLNQLFGLENGVPF